jgi:hypothetical protein
LDDTGYVAAITSLIHATRLHTVINAARHLLGSQVDGGVEALRIMTVLPSLGEVKASQVGVAGATPDTTLLEYIAQQMALEKVNRLASGGQPNDDDNKPSLADECKSVIAVAQENFTTLVTHVAEMESLLVQTDREIKRNTAPYVPFLSTCLLCT